MSTSAAAATPSIGYVQSFKNFVSNGYTRYIDLTSNNLFNVGDFKPKETDGTLTKTARVVFGLFLNIIPAILASIVKLVNYLRSGKVDASAKKEETTTKTETVASKNAVASEKTEVVEKNTETASAPVTPKATTTENSTTTETKDVVTETKQ